MLTMYVWFSSTSLEYAAPVWHSGLTQAQHVCIELVQKRCFQVTLAITVM